MENLNQDQTSQQLPVSQVEQKPSFPKFILILVTVLVLGITGGVYYFLGIKKEELKACTLEAKQCPDGSYVSRTGPSVKKEKIK